MNANGHTDNHDSQDATPNARAVENVVELAQELAERLKAEGYAATDAALGLMHVAHLLASNVGKGLELYKAHFGLCVETGEFFECAKCSDYVAATAGAADDQPDVCDECHDTEAA